MYAGMFSLSLCNDPGSREQAQSGRALATVLEQLPGFLACLAVAPEEGGLAMLCICGDASALEVARQATESWLHARGTPTAAVSISLISGEVVAQRGF